MIRIAMFLAALAMTACADDEKQPVDPLADVTDDAVVAEPESGAPVVVEESATGDSEASADDNVVAVDSDGEMGAGLKNLKIQESPETVAMPPVQASAIAKPGAKVGAKTAAAPAPIAAKFKTPNGANADGKHLWVFVDTLVVRGKPVKGASQVGTLPYGVMVPVLEAKDGFVKIGENQWVSRRFLTDRQSKFIPAH